MFWDDGDLFAVPCSRKTGRCISSGTAVLLVPCVPRETRELESTDAHAPSLLSREYSSRVFGPCDGPRANRAAMALSLSQYISAPLPPPRRPLSPSPALGPSSELEEAVVKSLEMSERRRSASEDKASTAAAQLRERDIEVGGFTKSFSLGCCINVIETYTHTQTHKQTQKDTNDGLWCIVGLLATVGSVALCGGGGGGGGGNFFSFHFCGIDWVLLLVKACFCFWRAGFVAAVETCLPEGLDKFTSNYKYRNTKVFFALFFYETSFFFPFQA